MTPPESTPAVPPAARPGDEIRDLVLLDVAAGVATVTINRPDALNALDTPTKDRLLRLLGQVAADPGVRCVVLTGVGRGFCVGQDLREHAALQAAGDESLWTTVPRHFNPVVELIATMGKPVVAAVNGVAAGAGAAFALAADFRVMVQDGGLNLAFVGIGLSCDSGSSWTLPRLVGTGRAKELLLLPRTVGAQECLELGLASEVVPPDGFDAAVAALAARLAAGPTLAYAAVRQAVAFSAGHSLTESLAREAELIARTGASEDHHGAVAAFLSRRTPTFNGR